MIFRIIREDELYELEEEVNRYLKDGYEPVGGVTIRYIAETAICFYQSLIKK